jgi:hypothetical protein
MASYQGSISKGDYICQKLLLQTGGLYPSISGIKTSDLSVISIIDDWEAGYKT